MLRSMSLSMSLLLLFSTACRDPGTLDTADTDVTPDNSDADNDGHDAIVDCDDNDATINPDAAELCDGIDNDCSGTIDDNATDASTWYADSDGDGFGGDTTESACESPDGYVAEDGDCDDSDAAYNPSATEDDCSDPNDYNCDGSVGFADADGDGFAACEECDDSEAAVNPSATEACDDIDNNCDGAVDEAGATGETLWYADTDGDGFGDADTSQSACAAPDGYVADATDCNDASDAALPGGSELCDELDNDCDGTVDNGASDAPTWYGDGDGDGAGDPAATQQSCTQPDGTVSAGDDCDDGDATSFPGGTEVCDEADNNCDGTSDEGVTTTFYLDDDGDGAGEDANTVATCALPDGYAASGGDCNDDDAAIKPGATEVCDDVDNDCNTLTDDEDSGLDLSTGQAWHADVDGDGFGDSSATTLACAQPDGLIADEQDCDDGAADVNPDAIEQWYDGVDSDCSGGSDNDQDGDGEDADFTGGGDCEDTVASLIDNCELGSGGDGPGSITNSDELVNDYAAVISAASAGTDEVTVDSTTGFAEGDELMIIQHQGDGAGVYEFARIASISGSTFTLTAPLVNDYATDEPATSQVVRVPNYTTLTVGAGASIVSPPWDGSTGGVVAFRAQDAALIEGSVYVSMQGFQGVPRGNTNNHPGDQGEGTGGAPVRAREANGNGGGGGERNGCECCWGGAGGGGGHASAGTVGTDGGNACQKGGFGGEAVGNPEQSLIFFGGAGAQGGADEDGHGSGGANGGGIVFIGAAELTVTGSIEASGQNGQKEYNFAGCGSGGGGGGAGGAIYLEVGDADLGAGLITALGGPGGDEGGNCGTRGGGASDGRITVDATGSLSGTTSPALVEL